MKRFEGKSLEDALESAAQSLGVERYRLAYHIILERRGFLGGTKRVVIEADVNESTSAPAAELDEHAQPPMLLADDYTFPRSSSPPRPGRGRRQGPQRDRERTRNTRPDNAPREPVPAQGPQSEEAAGVRDWCEELFDLAQLELDLRTEETEEQISVKLYGPDDRLLVSHGGELLDSIQVIVNKALIQKNVEKKIEFDCREFKERRLSELGRRVLAIADQVRREGREQILEAMSPIERRIVHVALQDDREVTTESRGEGFYKRIAIVQRVKDEGMKDEG